MNDEWRIVDVVTQHVNWGTSIGVAFSFRNGMRHAFHVPMNCTMDDMLAGVQAIKAWTDRKEQEDNIANNLTFHKD